MLLLHRVKQNLHIHFESADNTLGFDSIFDFCMWTFCSNESAEFEKNLHKAFTLAFDLKLVSATFYQIFIFHQIIALQKLWKIFFISSKKLFLFLRYSNFCIFVFPSFFSLSVIALEVELRKILVYDVINCLNGNLITHFVWYFEKEIRCDTETLFIDEVLNMENLYGKIMHKMCTKS